MRANYYDRDRGSLLTATWLERQQEYVRGSMIEQEEKGKSLVSPGEWQLQQILINSPFYCLPFNSPDPQGFQKNSIMFCKATEPLNLVLRHHNPGV